MTRSLPPAPRAYVPVRAVAFWAGALALAGCAERPPGERGDASPGPAVPGSASEEPCAGPATAAGPSVSRDAAPPPSPEDAAAEAETDIPRYAANSLFEEETVLPEIREGKRLWADSFLWAKAPELLVETWLTGRPDTEGKYVLIEFWNTWCPACRRSLELLNRLHERFASELVVIGVCDETEEDVRAFRTHEVRFFSAIDTQARTKNALGVFGVPHAVILEPEGYVVWEGYPLLKGYELTEELVDTILQVGRDEKARARPVTPPARPACADGPGSRQSRS